MTFKEAMRERHTVRKYLDRPLPEDIVRQLDERVSSNNEKYGLSVRLATDDMSAFGPVLRLILAKGVKNYFVLAGPDTPEAREKLGYVSADLMLYAQTLGLNTWWVGGTYSRRSVKAEDGDKVIGVVAVGYGATQGTPHRSKSAEAVSSYEGKAPQWFKDGVEAALLAPTAINRQSFFIKGSGNKVFCSYGSGAFSEADKGIVKYHFEVGAGVDNFEWAAD